MSLDSCDKTTVRVDDKSAADIMQMLGITNCCGCTTYYVDVPFDITFDASVPERVREYESKKKEVSLADMQEWMAKTVSKLLDANILDEKVSVTKKPDRYAVTSHENGHEV